MGSEDNETQNALTDEIRKALERLDIGSKFSVTMVERFIARGIASANPRTVASEPKHPFSRVISWMLEQAAVTHLEYPVSVLRPPSQWQRGCPEIIPALSSQAWWATAAMRRHAGQADALGTASAECPSTGLVDRLSFIHDLEVNFAVIREELLALRGRRAFQQYRAPSYSESSRAPSAAGHQPGGATGGGGLHAGASGSSTAGMLPAADNTAPSPASSKAIIGSTGTSSGDWNVFYLDLHNGTDCSSNRALCPRTMEIIQRIPRAYGHCFFSAMAPKTHITTHTGPTNRKIRIHLPLVVPQPRAQAASTAEGRAAQLHGLCRLRVGPHTEVLREGTCVAFDDSYQHEAWNDSEDAPRINLIIDVWHPDLSDEEVKLLSFIRSSQMRRAKALSEAGAITEKGMDFFAILAEGRRRGADDDAVFGEADGASGSATRPGQDDEAGGADRDQGGRGATSAMPFPVDVRDD